MSSPARSREPSEGATARRGVPAGLWAARLPVALALLSAAGLLLEISFTRVLAVLHFSTFSYLVLSTAVLGLGAGAALAVVSASLRRPERWPLWVAGTAVSTLALTFHSTGPGATATGALLIPLAALPYAFLGLTVAGMFAARSDSSPRLYLADLAGAATGTLLAVPVLDAAGGSGAMLVAACAAAVAGLLLAPRSPIPITAAVLSVGAIALHIGGLGTEISLERLATPKPIRESLRAGAETVATRWDSFARTDLIRLGGSGTYVVYLDGGAGSVVPDASEPATWQNDIAALAFAVDPPDSAFLIGTGGGLDIALARSFAVDRIVAAEINSAAVEFARSLASHAGDLYGPPTELHLADGRGALERTAGSFDLILLSHVVSQTAEARGLALVENGLYTVEAFGTYLERLSPDGRIALELYDELTLTRALLTAVAALTRHGVPEAEAARHLFAALDTRTSPAVPLLLVSASPLDRERAISWARTAESRGLALLFVPGLLAPPALEALLAGTTGVEEVARATPGLDLAPVTDDRPYFYQFEAGLPRSMRPLLIAVLAALAATLLAAVTVRGPVAAEARAAPVLFAALGAGFMLVEIGILQRTQLVIGHPSLALAAVLGSLLLGAAAGSGLSGRCPAGREYRWIAVAGAAAAALHLAWSSVWPSAAAAITGMAPGAAALAAASTALPLAVVLGMPFPLALRAAGRFGPADAALAWTVNGVASVAGAVGATALGMVYGTSATALAAVSCYGLAASWGVLLWRLRKRRGATGSATR